MTPQTVHWIAQDIRHVRAMLSVQEEWLQRQEPSESRSEQFRRITFWRRLLKVAEHQLATGQVGHLGREPVPAVSESETAAAVSRHRPFAEGAVRHGERDQGHRGELSD